MKKTKIGLMLITFAFLIFSIAMVESATTVVKPTAGNHINGTYFFNSSTTIPNALNCSFATTGDGVFAITLNDSAGQLSFNTTNNTALLTETASTTITVVCYNSSASMSGTSTGVSIDNTDPTCSFSIDHDIVEYMDGVGVTATDSSSDTNTLTYNYVLYCPSNSVKTTSTEQSPSFELDDFDVVADCVLAHWVTDEVNKVTYCSNKTIMVEDSTEDSGSDVIITTATTTDAENNKKTVTGVIIGVGAIILIAVIGFFFIFVAKKKKR